MRCYVSRETGEILKKLGIWVSEFKVLCKERYCLHIEHAQAGCAIEILDYKFYDKRKHFSNIKYAVESVSIGDGYLYRKYVEFNPSCKDRLWQYADKQTFQGYFDFTKRR